MQATWPQAELLMHGSYAEAMDPRMNYHWAADRPSTHLHDRAPCGQHHVADQDQIISGKAGRQLVQVQPRLNDSEGERGGGNRHKIGAEQCLPHTSSPHASPTLSSSHPLPRTLSVSSSRT